MNFDEVVDLPAPHARVAERRRVREANLESRTRERTRDKERTRDTSVSLLPPVPKDTTPVVLDPPPTPSPPRHRSRGARVDDESEARVVLAIDYGTTFTGIAYAQTTGRAIDLDDIHVVQNWPGASEVKVPSQISYSNSRQRLAQYGYSIDENSDVLSKTKLELQAGVDRGRELSTFTQTLHGLASLRLDDASAVAGRIPRHLAKTAEDIVQDYLERVADVTYDDMVETLGRVVPEQIPIDVIITHPAKWSADALDKTYRAATNAFCDRFPTIRHVSFVSEPEACAHYTLRAAQKLDHARFRRGDCFIVVDAGGGTVDLASFQITDIDPVKNKFKMEPVGHISGYACGSTYVDEGFVDTLKSRLDPADAEKLVGNGPYGDGGHFLLTKDGMHVFREFLPVKHGFKGTDTGMVEVIPLPRDMHIEDRPDRGIRDGNLQLTADDIRDMFRFSVDKTLALIGAQINALENGKQRCKVKSIFLSGGFAKSEYLFSRVADFAGQQGKAVEKGGDCWCAVSKGAVMKGLGLLTAKPPVITRSPCFYGVKTRQHYSAWRNADDRVEVDALGVHWATDQVKWFVRQADAILPGRDRVSTYNCHWLLAPKEVKAPSAAAVSASAFVQAARRRKASAAVPVTRDIVFVASSEADASRRFGDLDPSKLKVVVLPCDMTKVPLSQQSAYGEGSHRHVKFSVQVEVRVSTTEATITVTSGGIVVAGPERILLDEKI